MTGGNYSGQGEIASCDGWPLYVPGSEPSRAGWHTENKITSDKYRDLIITRYAYHTVNIYICSIKILENSLLMRKSLSKVL